MIPENHPPLSRATLSTSADFGVGLALDGVRLGVTSESSDLVEHVSAVMVPPCRRSNYISEPDWFLRLEDTPALTSAEVDGIFADRPVLSFPRGGPQLAITGVSGGLLQAVGRYRPDSPGVRIDVDGAERLTRLMIPAGEPEAMRWADYATRVFFASRLLASGWRMLHASAVALDGKAVLILAAQGGGKSTLAHRACVELGAGFLADDLVLISDEGMVMGWPTRVAVPVELVRSSGEASATAPARGERKRVTFPPREHRSAFDMTYSSPVPLGAMVCVRSDVLRISPGVHADVLTSPDRERFIVKAADVPAQRLFVSDLVGLMGGRRVDLSRESFEVEKRLWETPAALLTLEDMAEFARAPVWESLAPLLSEFGRQ